MAHATKTVAIIIFLAPWHHGFAAAPPGDIKRCTGAAADFLKSLSPEQRTRTFYPFDHPGRLAFTYRPGAGLRKEGIRTGELLDPQRMRLHDLLTCGLSSQGYQKVLAIMRRDDIAAQTLRQIRFARPDAPVEAGRGFYWMAIFGEPDLEKPWGWQFEGHHLAFNVTAAAGRLSVTPAFMGADPAVLVSGTWTGFRVLDGEFARGLELMDSLRPEQRERAVLSAELPESMFNTPERRDAFRKFEGLPGSALDEAQRRLLGRVIEEYVRNVEPAAAERLLAKIEADGVEKIHFAWMGPTERGQPVYYRVHGPSIIIEFTHAPDIRSDKMPPDINHIHTYWHVPGEDFGSGFLGQRSSQDR